jgi:hypothetical protein
MNIKNTNGCWNLFVQKEIVFNGLIILTPSVLIVNKKFFLVLLCFNKRIMIRQILVNSSDCGDSPSGSKLSFCSYMVICTVITIIRAVITTCLAYTINRQPLNPIPTHLLSDNFDGREDFIIQHVNFQWIPPNQFCQ